LEHPVAIGGIAGSGTSADASPSTVKVYVCLLSAALTLGQELVK